LNFVLDASISLAWCFADEGGDYVVGVLEALRSSEAVVASQWTLEVTNGLLTAERKGRIDADSAARFARLLLALPIVVEPVARRLAFDETRRLARAHGQTTYDAAYLELALRHGVPLASLDEALSKAADQEGVPPFVP
jgi:predicted nucleic acid-binding protein